MGKLNIDVTGKSLNICRCEKLKLDVIGKRENICV